MIDDSTPMALSDEPEWVKAAFAFGAEHWLEHGTVRLPNANDRYDIAHYHPNKLWIDMLKEDQDRAIDAWFAGIKSEKRHRHDT